MPSVAPTVSVVIPAYNAARYIGMALMSAQEQTFHDHELIVVDDGSSDDTAERAAAVAPEATILRQPNGGPGRARNLGVARARGRLVAFLDADDVWFPDALATLVGYAQRHPEAGLVCARLERPFRFTPRPVRDEPPRARFCDIFHKRFQIHVGAVLLPRAVFAELGGFDERREIHVEDWDLWLRIAARHPVGYVPRAVLWNRPVGIMSVAENKAYRGRRLTIDKTLPLCAQACALHRADPDACVAERIHLTQHVHGRELLRAGRRHEARQAFNEALEHRPLAVRTQLLRAASFLGAAPLRWLYGLKDLVAPPR